MFSQEVDKQAEKDGNNDAQQATGILGLIKLFYGEISSFFSLSFIPEQKIHRDR